MNILERLANAARERVSEAKERTSHEEIKELAESEPIGELTFENALKEPKLSVIAECKKASPSKGLISNDFKYVKFAMEYESAGADAVSVLTEPTEFLGADTYLKDIAECVKIPCLRKDFIVDEYMIYQAKLLGAKAYLLIVSLLSLEELKNFIAIGESLGMSALVETRNEDELKVAVKAGGRIIGVNNRNLKDFSVDTTNAAKLRKLAPKDVLFVAESGIKTAEDMKAMQDIGADAVLIGEALMLSEDKAAKLKELRSKL